jgi:hypothetical protein
MSATDDQVIVVGATEQQGGGVVRALRVTNSPSVRFPGTVSTPGLQTRSDTSRLTPIWAWLRTSGTLLECVEPICRRCISR